LGGTMLVGMASGMAGTLASQIVSGNGLDFGAILKAGAISALTAGITNGITYNSTTGFGLNSFGQSVTALPPGTFTLGQLAGLSNISSALVPGATAASGTLPQMVLAMGAMATLDAGVQTAIGGGSFLDNLKNDAVADVAAAGAYAIGDEAKALTNGLGNVGGELVYTGLHAVLGCAASAAEGTGCAGGAIGGAVSALTANGIAEAVTGGQGVTNPAQLAMITAGTTLLSGTVAAALGQNAAGAVNAAANETLNNSCDHACGQDKNDIVKPVQLEPQSGVHEEVSTNPSTGVETVTETVGGLPLASALAGANQGAPTNGAGTAIQTYWPTNGGFLLSPTIGPLDPGYQFSRYGGFFNEAGQFQDFGNYVAPVDVPFGMRSLPAGTESRPLTTYEVVRPIPGVMSGPAAPAFNQLGLGMQHQLPMTIQDYIEQGFIKIINQVIPSKP
jgi:filamentous hemagglutinin